MTADEQDSSAAPVQDTQREGGGDRQRVLHGHKHHIALCVYLG